MNSSEYDQNLPSSKTSNISSNKSSNLYKLDEHTAKEPAKYLPLKEIAALSLISKSHNQLFQPILNKAKAVYPLLAAVVHGNPEALAILVLEKPALLFQKGEITDPAGRTFYDVSPYQLMTFLCDDDMKAQIMLLISPMTKEMTRLRQEQYAEISSGGADLVKLNFDPTNLAEFDRILQHSRMYRINDELFRVTFSLMENPDAILYYKGTDGDSIWYYANRETRTIERIQPQPKSAADEIALSKFQQSMDFMVNNSARRSNDAEHDIIAKTMDKSLVRNGIRYQYEGNRYRDTRHDFNSYYNAYRELIRHCRKGRWGEAAKCWNEKLADAQKQVMWLLQRYCEKNRPFFPLSDFKSSPFNRELEIYIRGALQLVYREGSFLAGFGGCYAIYKGTENLASGSSPMLSVVPIFFDLIAVNQLVEDAKTNVIESRLKQGVSHNVPRPF